jgi:hypothetical protein
LRGVIGADADRSDFHIAVSWRGSLSSCGRSYERIAPVAFKGAVAAFRHGFSTRYQCVVSHGLKDQKIIGVVYRLKN